MRSNIRGLQAFCAAAQHLSFKEAANDLCLTPVQLVIRSLNLRIILVHSYSKEALDRSH